MFVSDMYITLYIPTNNANFEFRRCLCMITYNSDEVLSPSTLRITCRYNWREVYWFEEVLSRADVMRAYMPRTINIPHEVEC